MLQYILHIQLVLFLGCMEYDASMPGVVSVEGTKQPYNRGCCEIYWLVEVLTNLDFVWLVSGFGISTLYFYNTTIEKAFIARIAHSFTNKDFVAMDQSVANYFILYVMVLYWLIKSGIKKQNNWQIKSVTPKQNKPWALMKSYFKLIKDDLGKT